MKPERWREIERICNSALELEPGERKRFVEKECAGDAVLLKEVERLLARQQQAEDFIAVPVLEMEETGVPGLDGSTVLHYQIKEKIGQGGMGEVFLAHDSVLDREVALKFLPDIFSGDPERLARFEREAKLLASLNHPNVAAIHGLEQVGGIRFLVLELVEGETLAQRIARGPLPIDETLSVCRQIAEGLEAAHEKGIVHRDLKPANVKITPEGKVKVLDFGLAKAFHEESPAADARHSPTLTDQMTHPGVILGTAAYMAPEQAKGKTVDKRADIWAFGCILFECLTGSAPFKGETVTETVAAILKGEPAWTLLPAETPPAWRLLLRRCLQKDPGLRLRDIGDARIELGDSAGREAVPADAVPAPRRISVVWLAACVALAVLAGVLIGMVLTRYLQPAPPASMVTSTIKVEPGHWLDGLRVGGRPSRPALAISGDGTFIVYSAIVENPDSQAKPQLYLRRMGQPTATPIRGTEGGIHPFLSPDNRWVGFWADNKLMKVPVEGGVPNELCHTTQWLFGASWGPDNSIVFTRGRNAGLSRVSADGGTPETLISPDPNRDYCHNLPSWLPNGKAVLFTGMKHGWDYRPWVAVLRLDTRERRDLLPDAADARYVPTGHLVFLRQGTLMAVRFDPARLEVIGQPQPLRENVMQGLSSAGSQTNTGAGQFAISDTGRLIYAAGGIVPPPLDSLVWVDQKGTEEPVTDKKCAFFAPRLSPDGKRIAYGSSGREDGVWVYDRIRDTHTPLTGKGKVWYPIWSPDGKWLFFDWIKSTVPNLFRQPYDASAPMEQRTISANTQYPGSWSSDGNTVALVEEVHLDTGADVAMLDLRSGRVTRFLNSPANERFPEFSPVGSWVAYASDESGSDEVWVQPFPGSGMKIQISSGGGVQPLWARDGKKLFYRWGNQVWAVDIRTDGGFVPGKPYMLFDKAGHSLGGPVRSYDLSLDGQRFLMVKMEQRKPEPVTEIILVQNWFEELKRFVPTK